MENNTGGQIVLYIIEIPAERKDDLGVIRNWSNLKLASDGDTIWIKEITPEQLKSPEIIKLPKKTIYTLRQPHLFKLDGLVPHKRLPQGLLWTPIDRALPLTTFETKSNYYKAQNLKIHLAKTDTEKEPDALLVELNDLDKYINSAPSIRLNKIKWVIIKDKALLVGKPLLPIRGQSFWAKTPFLLPSGMDIIHNILHPYYTQMLNSTDGNWILWLQNNAIIKIPTSNLKPLSISSFRLTMLQANLL